MCFQNDKRTTPTQTPSCTHAHTNTYTHPHTHTHTHTHIHTHMHTYPHTHTHMHTHTPSLLWPTCLHLHIHLLAARLTGCVCDGECETVETFLKIGNMEESCLFTLHMCVCVCVHVCMCVYVCMYVCVCVCVVCVCVSTLTREGLYEYKLGFCINEIRSYTKFNSGS